MNAWPPPTTKTVVVKYYPGEAYWFRVLDFVQPIWFAIAGRRFLMAVAFMLALLGKVCWVVTKVVLKIGVKLLVVTVVVGVAMSLMVMSFLSGSNKLLKVK